MNDMVARLTVTADASQVITATRPAQAAIQGLANETMDLSRATKSARDSADVFARELDQSRRIVEQLRAQYDPMYVATQRWEQGQIALRRALQQGDLSLTQHDKLLEQLQAEYRRTEQAQTRLAAATGRLTTATRGGAGGMQNFSYQLQDVFTQVGMGVPVMISLGQQAPQMLSGFGQVGAILGVVAAAVLPLSAAVFGLGYEQSKAAEKSKTLADYQNEAGDAIDRARAAVKLAVSGDLETLREQYGQVNDDVLNLVATLAELEVRAAQDTVTTALNKAFESEGVRAAAQAVDDYREQIVFLEREISALQAQADAGIGLNVEDQIAEMRADIEALSALEGLDEVFSVDPKRIDEFNALRDAIDAAMAAGDQEALLNSVVKLRTALAEIPEGPLADMAEELARSESLLRRAIAATNQLETGAARVDFSAAAASAGQMADQIYRAIDAVNALQAQQITDLRRSEIELEFVDDPVGRAGALAREEIAKRQDALRTDADTLTTAHLDAEAHAYVRQAEAIARNREELKSRRRELTQSSRRSGSSGSGSGGGQSDHDRAVKDIQRQLARLEPTYEADLAAAKKWREGALANLSPLNVGYQQFADQVDQVFNGMLKEAYEADLERRSDWQAGIERGLNEVLAEQRTWADVSEDLLVGGLSRGEDAWADWVTTGKGSLEELVDFALEQFARMAYQEAIQPALSGVFDAVSGAIGGAFSSGTSHSGSVVGASTTSRTFSGLASDERMTVTKVGQTIFSPRHLENASQIVDALAVAAARPAMQSAANITINNNSSAQVEQQQTSNGDVEINIMDDIEREMAGRMRKFNSPLGLALRSMGVRKSYGTGRT